VWLEAVCNQQLREAQSALPGLRESQLAIATYDGEVFAVPQR